MGRSRGGLTTKIHALVDACGLPIGLKITEGQAHDGRSADDMLDTIRRGDVLLADRAYDSNALRQRLAARGARANVKPMPNRLTALRFSKRLYRKRNLVFWERFRFRPGKSPLVVPTPWGRIGFAVCADMIYRKVWHDYREDGSQRQSRSQDPVECLSPGRQYDHLHGSQRAQASVRHVYADFARQDAVRRS